MGPRCCMLLLLLFLVPAARAQLRTCSNPDPCVLDCADCDKGELVPDPTDCTRFYVCDTGSLLYPDPLECPDGEVFDKTTRTCVAGGTCTPCLPVCAYECSSTSSNNEISSFYDCSIYYECNGDLAGAANTCPSSAPYYDGGSCQTNQTLCCHCQPFCYTCDLGKLVPDPTDCRRYYACDKAPSVPNFSGTCSSGQYFDSQLRVCSDAAPCVTQCTNVVRRDGCIDPYTCKATGYFPKCPNQCTAEYYHCTTVSDAYIEANSCQSSYVFHPDTLLCVTEANCPY